MDTHMLARPERFFEDRFGLTSSALERLLGTQLAGRVDHADLFLEYRISEELTLEEGAVKKASRHVSQGAGIRWVSEIIELAGGRDIFAELRDKPSAAERVVEPSEVIRRDPQIILASWCGKPVDVAAIMRRPGWDRISAVRAGRIHEVDGADILSPGPSLLAGLRHIHEIVQEGLRG